MNRYNVYAHYIEDTIFYIGKGTGKRYLSKHSRNKHWNNKVKKYGDFTAKILADNLNESDAYELEELVVDTIGLDCLTNVCSGGGDAFAIPYDRNGENNPMYGKPHPNKGKKLPQNGHQKRLGTKHTAESIKKNLLNQPTRREVSIEGVRYDSMTQAERETGIPRRTIGRRINSGVYN